MNYIKAKMFRDRKRIILDSKLNTNINSFIINTANKSNTIIFYNKASKSQILNFRKQC